MGYLLYGLPAESIEIDDRTLAHIKIVMLAKLRRDESFAFSFEYDLSNGSGRSTVWVHPTIPMQFKFLGSRQAVINRAWLEALIVSANSVDGLRILPEPEVPVEETP
jgi:hypothetical protein